MLHYFFFIDKNLGGGKTQYSLGLEQTFKLIEHLQKY